MHSKNPVPGKEDGLDPRIVSLLSGIGSTLSTGAIAFVLDVPTEEVESSLERLRGKEQVRTRKEAHHSGWTSAAEHAPAPDEAGAGEWMGRLAEYALLSPGVTLSELMTVIRWEKLPARNRPVLLLSAARKAGEYGEFSLLAGYIMEIMDRKELGEGETVELLTMFEPRRLRGYSIERAESFVLDNLPVLRSTTGRILALTRLGELQLLQNRSSSAEEHLRKALQLSLESGLGEHIPAILESLGELTRDYKAMTELSGELEKVLDWVCSIGDPELEARIRAAAALAQSGLRMNTLAERTILSAMSGIPSLSLPAQLAVEWSRARVYIASGRRKAAMSMLQRALMLAESVNNQLTVMEILRTLVSEMKERPGYTVRNLISIMRNISRKASASGNLSNSTYALDHLTDMFTRTLQFAEAASAARQFGEITGSSEMLREEPLSAWCMAYISFLTDKEPLTGTAEGILPGTSGFLGRLAEGGDPISEAGVMAEHLAASKGGEKLVYALILALEAFARGKRKAASVIASALDSSFGSSSEDPFISWKLCVSGILSSRDRYSDDFFQSAQIMARQLDRLLFVWLLLRCRLCLELERDKRETAGLLLLLAELDRFILKQLPQDFSGVFEERSGAEARIMKLHKMAGLDENSTLVELRDELGVETASGMSERIFEIGGIASRISGRSEISASLEIMGRLLGANRVLALRQCAGEIEIIEGYGIGKWRLPATEIQDAILERPSGKVWIDSFQVTPFGSRRCLVITLKSSSAGSTQKRTMLPDRKASDNYLLAEVDLPFSEESEIPGYLIDSLCGQVGAALSLRSRESMAYMDRLTGAVIGYSWTSRLEEIMAGRAEKQAISVLLMGVDGMKQINHLFGYRVGDSALKALVSTVRSVLRPNDLIGRLRGDLFGVILPDTSEEEARLVAERICGAVAGVDIRPDRIPVTVSVGASTAGSSMEAHDLVLCRASEAMENVKARGGNRVLPWSEGMTAADPGGFRMFNTGDPGWDHSVYSSVMELLSISEPTLELISEKLRDALGSELVYIEDGRGSSAFVGSRFLRSISAEIGAVKEDGVSIHLSLLGKYDAMSSGLPGGGCLISAWESSGVISISVRNIFAALAALSGLIVRRMR
ncbi:MAG: GGDEF domain-containing protein [Candidatus Fermentibacteraceae bacterium]|nr:GGDEF domain-containing protein [Candidatus Fermentibacteraceae bacterium]MBN2607551.1 GGDEF domain-containing protein [Candidatus Fermentibacteraceae bacterium]